jgi:type IV secretion system protein VirD4
LAKAACNQVGRRLTEELEPKRRWHRLLLMLDEFRLDFFESALAFIAGYGLKSFLIAQSLNQIEKAYGQNNSILDNCHVRVSFATNDEDGQAGVRCPWHRDRNARHEELRWTSPQPLARASHGFTSRDSEAIAYPGEVMQLPNDDELVLVSGCQPIRAKKARYYEDAELKNRILPPPTLLSRPFRLARSMSSSRSKTTTTNPSAGE